MDRRVQTPGKSIYEKREVDPDQVELSRRGGSIRLDTTPGRLGLVCTGAVSRAKSKYQYNFLSGDSINFQLSVPQDTSDDSYKLVTVGGMDLTLSGTTLSLGGLAEISVTGTEVDVTLTRDTTGWTVEAEGSTSTSEASGGGLAFIVLLSSPTLKSAPPAIYDFNWTISSTIREEAFDGSGAALFYLAPLEPQLDVGGLAFNGMSGVFFIPYSSEFQDMFSGEVETAATDKIWSVVVEGRLGQTFPSAGSCIPIVEFGPLCFIGVTSEGKIQFISHETEVTSTAVLSAGDYFSLVAHRNGDLTQLSLELSIGSSAYTTYGSGTSPSVPPLLERRRLWNLYVGNTEGVGGTPAGPKVRELYPTMGPFEGEVSKLAWFTSAVGASGPKAEALFYFDFTGDDVEDQGGLHLPSALLRHSEYEGSPCYAAVGAEGDFTGVHSGALLSADSFADFMVRLDAKLDEDATSVQVGNYTFVVSNGLATIINRAAEKARTLGVPYPTADVAVQNLGPGVLDGCYGYGYRFVTEDGSVGPMRRLQSILSPGGQSVILGSIDGGGGEEEAAPDPTGERIFGQSFGRTHKGVEEFWKVFDARNEVDRFPLRPKDAPTTDTYTVELAARIYNTYDLQESIFERGGRGLSTGWSAYNRPASPPMSPFSGDFTTQVAFRPSTFQSSSTSLNGKCIFGYGHGVFNNIERKVGTSLGSNIGIYIMNGQLNGVDMPRLVVQRRKSNSRQKGDDWASEVYHTAAGMALSSSWTVDMPGNSLDGTTGTTGAPVEAHEMVIQHMGSTWAAAHPNYTCFWQKYHDYNLYVSRRGDALHIAVLDVTGTDGRGDLGTPGEGKTPYFAVTNPTFFSGTSNLRDTMTGAGHSLPYVGAVGARVEGDKYKTSYHYFPRGPLYGRASYDGSTMRVEPFMGIMYHARVWTDYIPFTTWVNTSWRRNAALGIIPKTGLPGPLNQLGTIHSDVAFVSESKHQYDVAGSLSQGDYYIKVMDGASDTNSSILEVLTSEQLGLEPPSWDPTAPEEATIGIQGTRVPLFTILNDATELLDQPFYFALSSEGDGSLEYRADANTRWIISNWFWDIESQRNAPFTLDELLGGNSLATTNWFSFQLHADKRIEGSDEYRVWYVSEPRINGQGLAGSALGLFYGSYLAPGNNSTTGDEKRSLVADFDTTGLFTLGGSPQELGEHQIDLLEFRLWDEDIFDETKPAAPQTAHLSQEVLDSGRVLSCLTFQPKETALQIPWGEGTFDHSTMNSLMPGEYTEIVGRGYLDTGNVHVSDADANLYGEEWSESVWCYLNASYSSEEVDHGPHVEAVGGDEVHPGLVVWDPEEQSESGGTPNQDGLATDAFPARPNASIVGIELFRTEGVPIGDPENSRDVADAVEAARNLPLRKLARIPRGSQYYVDNTPDMLLGAQSDSDDSGVPRKLGMPIFWGGTLGFTIQGESFLRFSAGGAQGLETYPAHRKLNVSSRSGAGPIQAAVEVNGRLLVLGTDWVTLLLGSPDDYEEYKIGGALGASGPHCVAVHSGMLFAFNGRLNAISASPSALQPGTEVLDIGAPIQELLPEPENTRLTVSAKLASLFVIDTVSGVTLRYHIPTKGWSIEDRDTVAGGDLADGHMCWIHKSGYAAIDDDSTAADDSVTDAPGSVDDLTFSSGGWFMSSGVAAVVGQRILVEDADGNTLVSRVLSVGGEDFSIYPHSALSVGTHYTVHFGVGEIGCLLDTGPYNTVDDTTLKQLDVDVLAGSRWRCGTHSNFRVGERPRSVDIDYVGAIGGLNRIGFGTRGQWQRAVLWNRGSELGRLGSAEMEIK